MAEGAEGGKTPSQTGIRRGGRAWDRGEAGGKHNVQTVGKGAENQAEVGQRGRWGEEFGRVPGNQLRPDGRKKGMGVFADCQKVVNVDADN
jgi:hypothetical protein